MVVYMQRLQSLDDRLSDMCNNNNLCIIYNNLKNCPFRFYPCKQSGKKIKQLLLILSEIVFKI